MATGDKRDLEELAETEFGLGAGMIDPGLRTDGRSALPVEQQLWEIYSRPRVFSDSELGLPGGKRPDLEETPVPKLLPGESEADRA